MTAAVEETPVVLLFSSASALRRRAVELQETKKKGTEQPLACVGLARGCSERIEWRRCCWWCSKDCQSKNDGVRPAARSLCKALARLWPKRAPPQQAKKQNQNQNGTCDVRSCAVAQSVGTTWWWLHCFLQACCCTLGSCDWPPGRSLGGRGVSAFRRDGAENTWFPFACCPLRGATPSPLIHHPPQAARPPIRP